MSLSHFIHVYARSAPNTCPRTRPESSKHRQQYSETIVIVDRFDVKCPPLRHPSDVRLHNSDLMKMGSAASRGKNDHKPDPYPNPRPHLPEEVARH